MSLLVQESSNTSLVRKNQGWAAPAFTQASSRLGVSVEDGDFPSRSSNNSLTVPPKGGRGNWRKTYAAKEWTRDQTFGSRDLRQIDALQPGKHARRSTKDDYSRFPLEMHIAGRGEPRIDKQQIGTRVYHRQTWDAHGPAAIGPVRVAPEISDRFTRNRVPYNGVERFVDRSGPLSMEQNEQQSVQAWRQ